MFTVSTKLKINVIELKFPKYRMFFSLLIETNNPKTLSHVSSKVILSSRLFVSSNSISSRSTLDIISSDKIKTSSSFSIKFFINQILSFSNFPIVQFFVCIRKRFWDRVFMRTNIIQSIKKSSNKGSYFDTLIIKIPFFKPFVKAFWVLIWSWHTWPQISKTSVTFPSLNIFSDKILN